MKAILEGKLLRFAHEEFDLVFSFKDEDIFAILKVNPAIT
jgi:hypothetical protein